MSSSALSVIIPTYRAADSIIRLLTSLARQDIQPHHFETIIIDDASPDTTVQLVKDWKKPAHFKLSLYTSTQNHGNGYTKNRGVQAATGTYVVFLDDHAYVPDTTFLRRLLEYLQTSSVDAVCGRYESPTAHDANSIRDLRRRHVYKKILPRVITWENWTTFSIVVSAGKRDLFRSVPFPEQFGHHSAEDTYWQLEAMARGYCLAYSPAFYIYHDHRLQLQAFIAKITIELNGHIDLLHHCAQNNMLERLPKLPHFLDYNLVLALSVLLGLVSPVGWLLTVVLIVQQMGRLYLLVRTDHSTSHSLRVLCAVTLPMIDLVKTVYVPLYLLVGTQSRQTLSYWIKQVVFWNLHLPQHPKEASYVIHR